MSAQYDLVVIGAGASGYAAAITAADKGAKVCLLDVGAKTACPNCQKRFHPNFFSVYVQHEIIEMSDKGKFKCPHCKIKDTCHRPH